jgi:hypothetical protein
MDIGGVTEGVTEALPAWVRTICLARDQCRGCALGFSAGEQVEWYFFLFATQSPYPVVFVPLHQEEPAALPRIETMTDVWRRADEQFDYEFYFDVGTFCEA